MGPRKETIMVLKVDLDCPRCYRKVKRLLCQFPQIHDQIYNEKQNTVMIKVICCSPEKIRDKLCCKGGKSIKSIEILHPKKPPPPPAADKPPEKPPPAPAPAPPPPANPKPPMPMQETPLPEPAPEPKPNPPPANPKPPEKITKNGSKKKGSPKPGPPPAAAPPPKPDPPPQKQPEPVPVHPVNPVPVNMCCSECYEGRRTGPCYQGYGHRVPPAPPPKPAPPPQQQPGPAPVHPVNPANMCCSECYEGRTTGPCYQGYGYGYEHGGGYGVPPPPPPPPAGGWCSYSDCCQPQPLPQSPPRQPRPSGFGDYYNNNKYKPGYCLTRCGDYINDENPTSCAIM